MRCRWRAHDTELEFETQQLTGVLVAAADQQPCHRLVELRDRATGALLSPDNGMMRACGAFTVFRAYARNGWLTELRNTPPTVTRHDDGAEFCWEPTVRHQVRLRARITVAEPGWVDAELWLEGHGHHPDYELLFSNYVAPELHGSALVQQDPLARTHSPERIRVTDHPVFRGMYTFFPRDERAAHIMTDGRGQRGRHYWKVACGRPYAAPMALADDSQCCVTLMGRPEDVSAVGVTYTAADDAADNVARHHALYLSLFGRDLHPGDGWHTRVRLAVCRETPAADSAAAALHAFLQETSSAPPRFEVEP